LHFIYVFIKKIFLNFFLLQILIFIVKVIELYLHETLYPEQIGAIVGLDKSVPAPTKYIQSYKGKVDNNEKSNTT